METCDHLRVSALDKFDENHIEIFVLKPPPSGNFFKCVYAIYLVYEL